MARTAPIAPRATIGPRTAGNPLITPSLSITVAETQWIARLNPDQDYTTVVWRIDLEYSMNNGSTWIHWRGIANTGIVQNDKGLYPSIGGTFPTPTGSSVPLTPTHIRGKIVLSEQITCGLVGITP